MKRVPGVQGDFVLVRKSDARRIGYWLRGMNEVQMTIGATMKDQREVEFLAYALEQAGREEKAK